MTVYFRVFIGIVVAICLLPSAYSQDSANGPKTSDTGSSRTLVNSEQSKEEIAKQLANPLANMISMPVQWEYARGLGKNQTGSYQSLLLQPVVPFNLGGGDTFLARPIIAGVNMSNVDGLSAYGVSSITLESFYAPNTGSSFIWGIGPYLRVPVSTNGLLGSQQSGAGVTGIALNRAGGWTYGLLAFQSWSIGGNSTYGTQNNLYGQPFVAYTTKTAWTFSADMEALYNYDQRRTSNPMNLAVGKLFVIDGMPVSFSAGPMYYLSTTPGGPSGWGARASITFVFLK